MKLLSCLLSLLILASLVAANQSLIPASRRSFLVTGGNKGQGFALCERILKEHDDTHVFLCSRNLERGQQAAQKLPPERVTVVQLDVTDEASVEQAVAQVSEVLGDTHRLHGLVSNAGTLWGYSLAELLDVCTVGVRRTIEAFLPLMQTEGGRILVVSSGLSPLMHTYSEHADTLVNSDWEAISKLMDQCREIEQAGGGPAEFEAIGFAGGPFAESAPDFHMYGLAKMFADAYMLSVARAYPKLWINSCDPGLVYTDLIDKMPKYHGKPIEETNAKTPAEGVEVHMRLLFGEEGVAGSGLFYAMNKVGELTSSGIDRRPDV